MTKSQNTVPAESGREGQVVSAVKENQPAVKEVPMKAAADAGKKGMDSSAHTFADRHIGPDSGDTEEMLRRVGTESLEALIDATIPDAIRLNRELELQEPLTESDCLKELADMAAKNTVARSFIGMGYSSCHTPPVIQRNILENPGWYTAYTPYQPEIAQGRLEAIFNFQTVVSDLTGLPVANASLLDEATAAAEAMALCSRILARKKGDRDVFHVDSAVHPQTIAVVKARALPLGIEVKTADLFQEEFGESSLGILLQYPSTTGEVRDLSGIAERIQRAGGMCCVAADLLSLMLLPSPGSFGADIVVGNSQRFGVPLGNGGPHAAFISTKEDYKREIPGRIVGLSKDSSGRPAFRLALQTREQHIRREKATSNICTAQVLLAVISSMYAVYHGPKGLGAIARRVHRNTRTLASALSAAGIDTENEIYFDTLKTVPLSDKASEIQTRLEESQINLRRYDDGSYGISLGERSTESDISDIVYALSGKQLSAEQLSAVQLSEEAEGAAPLDSFSERSDVLQAPVFNSYHSETEMLRYLARLEARDLSLKHSMIPLGSCTMKLNATSEMMPITYQGFSDIHPYAPEEQLRGYAELYSGLEAMLSEITGFPAISLQPNAGSQGEYAGLLAIRNYFRHEGDRQRKICLIPTSAHGTNPASAIMAGLKVVLVSGDENGNVDLTDLDAKLEEHGESVAALMLTYPSTHGVFESRVKDIADKIHSVGAFVYMDGANLNAQVGLCRPADFGMDVCHLNLHKTFCIPHGGGGPGVGPIGLCEKLAPFAPTNPLQQETHDKAGPVAAAPQGSASILPISYAYIRQMGAAGLKRASQIAILNANYIATRLGEHYPILYKGEGGYVAHECILDLRNFRQKYGVQVEDVAKRLMDYGFHAPTVSWPVAETLMVEPTESESKAELDRFCDAMISIKEEIELFAGSEAVDSPLKGAPHTVEDIASDDWPHAYSRETAVFPQEWVRERKFWPAVGRIDSAYGDRNFCCTLELDSTVEEDSN